MLNNCHCCSDDCDVEPESCTSPPFSLFLPEDIPVGPTTFDLDILTIGNISMNDGDFLQDGDYDAMVSHLDQVGCQQSPCSGTPAYSIDPGLHITPLIAPFTFFNLKNYGNGYAGLNQDYLRLNKFLDYYPAYPTFNCEAVCHYTHSINSVTGGGVRRYSIRKMPPILINSFASTYCSECQERYNSRAGYPDGSIGYPLDDRVAQIGSAAGYTALTSTSVSTQAKMYVPFLEHYYYHATSFDNVFPRNDIICGCDSSFIPQEYAKTELAYEANRQLVRFGRYSNNYNYGLCHQCGDGLQNLPPGSLDDCFSNYYLNDYSFFEMNPFCWYTRHPDESCSSTNVDLLDRNPYTQVIKNGLYFLGYTFEPSRILSTPPGSPITTYTPLPIHYDVGGGNHNLIGCVFKFEPGKTKLKITQPFNMTAFSNDELASDRRRFYFLCVCEANAGPTMDHNYISIYVDLRHVVPYPAHCEPDGIAPEQVDEYAIVCTYPGQSPVIAPTTSSSRIQYDDTVLDINTLGIEIERYINPEWNNRIRKITFFINDIVAHEKTYPGFGGVFGPQNVGREGRGICDSTVLEWRASIESGDLDPTKQSTFATSDVTPYSYSGDCNIFDSTCAGTNPFATQYNSPGSFVDPYNVTIGAPSLHWS